MIFVCAILFRDISILSFSRYSRFLSSLHTFSNNPKVFICLSENSLFDELRVYRPLYIFSEHIMGHLGRQSALTHSFKNRIRKMIFLYSRSISNHLLKHRDIKETKLVIDDIRRMVNETTVTFIKNTSLVIPSAGHNRTDKCTDTGL